jgi:hypothetical protein
LDDLRSCAGGNILAVIRGLAADQRARTPSARPIITGQAVAEEKGAAAVAVVLTKRAASVSSMQFEAISPSDYQMRNLALLEQAEVTKSAYGDG